MTSPSTRPRGGRAPRPGPRERLLAAAETLLYREGVHVGVDRLCAAADVSKRSMYQHFSSKDEVIVEMLDRRARHLVETWADDPSMRPRDRILAVFDALFAEASDAAFRGCPFVNAATELKDPDHAASVAARGYKLALTRRFEDLAREGGARDPSALAVQLTLVFDGACAYAVVRGAPAPGRETALVLLAAQGL